jgi:hypothetical protein
LSSEGNSNCRQSRTPPTGATTRKWPPRGGFPNTTSSGRGCLFSSSMPRRLFDEFFGPLALRLICARASLSRSIAPRREPDIPRACDWGREKGDSSLISTSVRMIHLRRTSDEKRPGRGRQRINPREFATTGPRTPETAANYLLHRGLRQDGSGDQRGVSEKGNSATPSRATDA